MFMGEIMQKKSIHFLFCMLLVACSNMQAYWGRRLLAPLATAMTKIHVSTGKFLLKSVDRYTSTNTYLKSACSACSSMINQAYPNQNFSKHRDHMNSYAQELGLEPIETFKASFEDINALAEVQLRGATVCDEKLDQYGEIQREFVLKHELMHHKYRDVPSRIAYKLASTLCTGWFFYYFLHQFDNMTNLFAIPALFWSWTESINFVEAYQEGRADKEAAYATAKGCPTCMDEIANMHIGQKHKTCKGYLGYYDYKRYADKLRNAKQVRYCDKHTKS